MEINLPITCKQAATIIWLIFVGLTLLPIYDDYTSVANYMLLLFVLGARVQWYIMEYASDHNWSFSLRCKCG